MPQQQHRGAATAEDLYRTDEDWYENSILLAALRCPDLWPMFNKTLCLDPGFRAEANDFSSPLRYNLFRAIRKYRGIQSEAGVVVDNASISSSTLTAMLRMMYIENASSIHEDDIPETVKFFSTLVKDTQTEEELETLTKFSYSTWILEKKMEAVQEDAQFMDIRGAKLLDVMHEVTDELKSRLGSEEEDTLKDVVQILDQSDIVTERLPFSPSMDPFNIALGGGLGRKEHIMIVGPTGAGKTVFACQVAADMAIQGHKVCYVTTEQPANELLPRIVSNLSSSTLAPIRFSIVKDGIEKDKLSPEQNAQIETIKTRLAGNLGIEEWLGSGLTASDLDTTVRKFKKRYGTLDVLILDWIGGALVNGVDPKLKRDYYLDAAQKMKDLAYAHDIATVSMAQAVADVAKVKYISDKHIAECKTMHREAVAGFGISAMADARPDTETTYSPNQYLYAFKSRKAPGMVINLTRAFDFQAFKLSRISTTA